MSGVIWGSIIVTIAIAAIYGVCLVFAVMHSRKRAAVLAAEEE